MKWKQIWKIIKYFGQKKEKKKIEIPLVFYFFIIYYFFSPQKFTWILKFRLLEFIEEY